jgi:hypothetical protein
VVLEASRAYAVPRNGATELSLSSWTDAAVCCLVRAPPAPASTGVMRILRRLHATSTWQKACSHLLPDSSFPSQQIN